MRASSVNRLRSCCCWAGACSQAVLTLALVTPPNCVSTDSPTGAKRQVPFTVKTPLAWQVAIGVPGGLPVKLAAQVAVQVCVGDSPMQLLDQPVALAGTGGRTVHTAVQAGRHEITHVSTRMRTCKQEEPWPSKKSPGSASTHTCAAATGLWQGRQGRQPGFSCRKQLTDRGWDGRAGAVDGWQERPVAAAGGHRCPGEVCLADSCARLFWLQPAATWGPVGGIAWHWRQGAVGAHCRRKKAGAHTESLSAGFPPKLQQTRLETTPCRHADRVKTQRQAGTGFGPLT